MKNLILLAFLATGCASNSPRLNIDLVRPWSSKLAKEYPSRAPWLAHHKSGEYELFYLAAAHSNDLRSPTMKMVEELFRKNKFEVLIIEPFPYSLGESPQWYVTEGMKKIDFATIVGGESSYAASHTLEAKIPFFGGEIDHSELFDNLKQKGYGGIDVVGFYFVRQIPQWLREKQDRKGLLEKKTQYIQVTCRDLKVSDCPTLDALKVWYKEKVGRELSTSVTVDDVAPLHGSPKFLHKISSELGILRDQFTLKLIERFLSKYKKVAVVYGSSHYINLKQSFDAALGEAKYLK